MRKLTAFSMLLITAVFWTMPAHSAAIMLHFDSIEWLAQSSECIVVAKVVKVSSATAANADKTEYQVITLAASNTLKGKPVDRIDMLLDPSVDKDVANGWLKDGEEFLSFLNHPDEKKAKIPAGPVWILRESGHWPDAISLGPIPRSRSAYPALTEDFTMLTPKDSILESARRAVAAMPKAVAPHSFTLELPEDSAAFKAVNGGSAVLLTVPVDSKLEARAQVWCKSRSDDQRATGASILRFFKSEKNIALLKPLLDDPATTQPEKYSSTGPGGSLQLVYRKRLYFVRQAAFESLQQLGVDVPKPLIEVLLEGRDEPDEELHFNF